METLCKEYKGLSFEMKDEDLYHKIYIMNGTRQVGSLKGYFYDGNLCGSVIKAVGLGALNVQPEFRRHGAARFALNMMTQFAIDRGCIVSYLHPFNFSYYRAMGYERVADHRMLDFPIGNLEGFERSCDVTYLPEGPESVRLMNDLYNRFAAGRNLMFRRDEKHEYEFVHHSSYYTRDENGEPDGYVTVQRERLLVPDTHHEHGTVLRVFELCYTSPAALRKLLSYLRMYEGNMRTIRLLNIAMSPEVERMLRQYTDMDIQVQPDISARVLDVQKVLSAVRYPEKHGAFTVKVTDVPKNMLPPELTNGVWHVEYQNGAAEVTRLADGSDYDLACDIPAFSQMIHGYESFGAETARYMQGVELNGSCDDFFHAFPNHVNGLYDLF